jgi:hypothetical protein
VSAFITKIIRIDESWEGTDRISRVSLADFKLNPITLPETDFSFGTEASSWCEPSLVGLPPKTWAGVCAPHRNMIMAHSAMRVN